MTQEVKTPNNDTDATAASKDANNNAAAVAATAAAGAAPPISKTVDSLFHRWRPLCASIVSRADNTVAHVNRILATPAGIDTVLMTANYGLVTLAACLDIYSRRQQVRRATAAAKTAAKAAATAAAADGGGANSSRITLLPGGTAVIATTLVDGTAATAALMGSSSGGSNSNSRLTALSRRARALTRLITDFRTFARLWGLLAVWAWAARTWRRPPTDPLVRAIVYAQLLASAAYQVLENGAFLAQHGVLPLRLPSSLLRLSLLPLLLGRWRGSGPGGGHGAALARVDVSAAAAKVLETEKERRRRDAAWLWSARFWALHVALDMCRLLRVRQMRQARRLAKPAATATDAAAAAAAAAAAPPPDSPSLPQPPAPSRRSPQQAETGAASSSSLSLSSCSSSSSSSSSPYEPASDTADSIPGDATAQGASTALVATAPRSDDSPAQPVPPSLASPPGSLATTSSSSSSADPYAQAILPITEVAPPASSSSHDRHRKEGGRVGEGNDGRAGAEVEKEDEDSAAWWRQFCLNLVYAPLTLHWSSAAGGLLSDVWVGVFGTAAGVISLRHVWKETNH